MGAASSSPSSLLGPLVLLRQRLDALREGRVYASSAWDRLRARLRPPEEGGALPLLTALSRELDRVGVHTLADARLLRQLGVQEGRAGKLARGLTERAREVLEEAALAVHRAELAQLAGTPLPGALTRLEEAYTQLVRVARVADVFARAEVQPSGSPPDEEAVPLVPRVAARAPAPKQALLAVAEFLEARARFTVEDVAQKRRDLDVAWELLLRLGGEEKQRTLALRLSVAEARERVRAVPPTASLRALLGEVRQLVPRAPARAYEALHGLYSRALEAGEVPLAAAARKALEPFLADGAPLKARLQADTGDAALADLAFQLAPEQRALLDVALGCARFFDVEDALAETVLETEARPARARLRRVPYPTSRMDFATTGSLDAVHDFVVTDPRTLLYDLASHRQRVRVYLEEEPAPRPRPVRRSSVRVYVCDASGSMYGPRARFRDAILLAELQGLMARSRKGLPVDPLYFSFFNDAPTELVRVEDGAEATRQMEKLFHHSPAEGQTDITLALMSAFDSIRAAQGRDPLLARATVVLVTDGEDHVDPELLRRVRQPLGGLPVALSFISLGEENPDLKAVVLEQRARGERAFYHHLSDADIQWAHTAFDVPWRTLLPMELPVESVDLAALMPQLEALEAVARGLPARDVVPAVGAFEAFFPARPGAASSAPVAAPVRERVGDILEAIAEAAALVPADARAAECVRLLDHLRGLYRVSVAEWTGALASGDSRVRAALERLRLLARPL